MIASRGRFSRRAFAPAVALALGVGLALVYAAGPKTGGPVVVSDDLPAGSAGSVGLSGGGAQVDGGLGQLSSGLGAQGGVEAESGFFSRLVTASSTLSQVGVDAGSVTFSWSEPPLNWNPQGTEFVIEVSSAPDFTGTIFSSAAYSPNAAPQGLIGNTTYYGRIRTRYMEGDEAVTEVNPLDQHLTMAYPASTGTIVEVGARSVKLAWDGARNAGGHSGNWGAGASLPLGRQNAAAAAFGRRVYVSGGVNGGTAAEVFVTRVQPDGTLDPWQTTTALPAPRHSHAMAAWRNVLYAVGGFDGSVRSSVWYAPILADGTVGEWRATTPLPAARYRHALAVSNGRLYVTGGDNGVTAQTALYYADIQADGILGSWTTVAAPAGFAARSGHAMALSSGTLFVAGGVTTDVTPTALASVLDAGGTPGNWTPVTALPAARTQGALVAGDGRLFFIGGHDGAAATATVYEAPVLPDRTLGPWSSMPALTAPVFAHAAVRASDRLLVLGGSDGSLALQEVRSTAFSGTEYLAEHGNDAGFAGAVDFGWRTGTQFEFDDLAPNTVYHFRTTARNAASVATARLVLGSTTTLAAVPAPTLSTFTSVDVSSIGVQWGQGLNPAGTEFRVQASTAPDFSGTIRTPGWVAGTSVLFPGLSVNTSYYFRVQTRNAGQLETAALGLGAVFTLSSAPARSAITVAQSEGFQLEWSTGNLPAWTRYEAQASTSSDFTTVAASTVTLSSATLFTGLPSAATFYARVRSINGNGLASAFDAAVSTRTASDTAAPGQPAGVVAYPAGTPNAVSVAWLVPGDDGASGNLPSGSAFYIQWSSQTSPVWDRAAAQITIATGPVAVGSLVSTLLTGLPAESTVTLRIWARDEAGNPSAPSDVFTAFSSPFSIARLDGASGDVGRAPSLAADRFGNLHLAYRGSSGDLRYMKRTAGVWSVPALPDPGVIAAEAAVAVDNEGNPQIAYRDAGVPRVKVARYSGGWGTTVVEPGDFRLGGFALDMDGNARLSYYDAAAGLKYASSTTLGWSTGTIVAGGANGRLSALVVDAEQNPRMLYGNDGTQDVWLSSFTLGRAWTTPPRLETGVRLASGAAVAIGGGGEVFAAYVDAAGRTLRLSKDGPPAILADDATASGGLALDGAGRPFVAYRDTGGHLKYARFTGVVWTTGTIDGDGDEALHSAVAIDGAGSAYVAYYDATRGDLKLAEWTGAMSPAAGGSPGGRAMAPSGMAGTALAGLAQSLQWSWTDNATGELGFRLYGSPVATGPYTLIADTVTIPAGAGAGGTVSYTENNTLTTNTTYYRYVVVVTSGGAAPSKLAAAYPFDAVDVTSPTFANNQPGDAAWRSVSSSYNFDLYDAGGSKLSKFQVRASTVSGGAGPALPVVGQEYTDVVTGLSANAYTTDWPLPPAVFAVLWESATNYITIKAFDGNGNATTIADAFYVLKDTTTPRFVVTQAGDATVRRSSGTLYDVDAFDSASGLARFQYSASTTSQAGDGSALGWADVAAFASSASYTADWPVAFDALPSEATNYITVRVWDTAGNTTTVKDAFYVRKDTTGPTVAITAPAAPFVSALWRLTASSSDANGVKGVEFAIQDSPPVGLYWTGLAFSNATPVFLPAGIPIPAWANQRSYQVVARASDTLGNYSNVYSTANFVFDASTPTVGVTDPVPGSAISALAMLAGTAADSGAGVATVEVRLRRNPDGWWWDWLNDRWAASPVQLSSAATGTGPWSIVSGTLLRANLSANTSYFIAARAVDGAAPANSSDFFVSGATFTFVDNAPPAAITDLAASSSTASGRIGLSWTAPGDDQTSGMILTGEYRIHYSTEASTAFSTAAAQVVLATGSVVPGTLRRTTLTGLVAGSTYYIRAFLSDDAGNWSALSNGATMQAGPELFNKITGHVVKTSSEGITAVLVECFNDAGTLVTSTFTVADGSGTFTLDQIPAGAYKVQATWTTEGIASSVSQDGIEMGTGNVDFVLEVRYTLATLTGTLNALAEPRGRLASAVSGFRVQAEQGHFSASKVELFAGGRRAVEVAVDPTGRWTISNLLPGKYGVRAFNGVSYTDIMEVEVGEGELKEVGFVYNALPEQSVFAFPNPARGATTFRFESPLAPLEAQVLVFDIAGSLVREIAGSEMSAAGPGLYHAPWDLRNTRGEPVASGVYLFMVKVKGGSQQQTAKVIKKLAVVK